MKNSFNNALYNIFGYIFPFVLSLFSVPYIVHKLTPELYGIYVLAISLMGFMSFLDLGFGQGIIKFVSQYEARKDYDRINKIVGVSMLIYLVMGLVGYILIFSLSFFLAKDVFHVSQQHVQTASLAFNVVSFSFLLNFINGVFSNIPKALQRYDVFVKIQSTIWFCMVVSTIGLLYSGRGLIAILTVHLFFQFVELVIFYFASKKILPSLRILLRFDRVILKEILGFSIFSAINNIMGNTIFRFDKIIIGAFLGTEVVAYYQIPFMIVQMVHGFINTVSQFLFPAISYIHSLGDKERLKHIYFKATRYVITLSLISTACLIFVGDTFIYLWMGKEFAEKSAVIIPIISTVFFFVSVSVVGFWFFNGLGKADINMASSLVGSLCYLIAALLLIPRFGLLGAATSFAFILVPFPVYLHILTRLLQTEGKYFLGSLIPCIIILIVTISLKQVISLPASIAWFVFASLCVIVISTFISYLFKIIHLEDVIEIKSKLGIGSVKA